MQTVLAFDPQGNSARAVLKYGIPELIAAEAHTQQKVHDFDLIPTVYGLGTIRPPYSAEDELAMLMEYIPGKTANIMSESDRDKLLDPQVIGLFVETLSHIHSRNIAHADFPHNILLSELPFSGVKAKQKQIIPYLIDFDASNEVQVVVQDKYGKKPEKGLRGATNFNSPEQFVRLTNKSSGSVDIDARNLTPDSDLYILGLMMYTLLTGIVLQKTDVDNQDYFKTTIYNDSHQSILMSKIRYLIPSSYFKRKSTEIDSALSSLFSTVLHRVPDQRSPRKRNVQKAADFVQKLYTVLGLWDPHK